MHKSKESPKLPASSLKLKKLMSNLRMKKSMNTKIIFLNCSDRLFLSR